MNHLESFGKVNSLAPSIVSYEWILEDFKNINTPTGFFFTSPLIPTEHPGIKWRLALYPNGRNKANKDYLDLCIQLFSSSDEIVLMSEVIQPTLRVFVLNPEDLSTNERAELYKFKLLPEIEFHNILLPAASIYDRFVTRQYIYESNNLFKNGCLSIGCEMVFYHAVFDPYVTNSSLNNHRLKEFDDFNKLLADDKFCDFTFGLGNKEIRVHKAILASRSPVFEAMFVNDIQEKQQNRVDIDDIQYPVMKELFRFVYTGTVNEMKAMASDLQPTNIASLDSKRCAKKYCPTI